MIFEEIWPKHCQSLIVPTLYKYSSFLFLIELERHQIHTSIMSWKVKSLVTYLVAQFL